MDSHSICRLPLGPRRLPAADGIDLWLCNLDRLPLDAGPDGESRRERMLKRRVQQKFITRLILGAYLDCPGKELRIERESGGRPRLAGAHASSGLHFSLSHSGVWLALAVGRIERLGVDIEVLRQLRRPLALAGRYFGGDEATWLAGLDEPYRSHGFLRQWTAREALVKAMGAGLAGNLRRIALTCEPCAIRDLPPAWPGPGSWCLRRPECPGELAAHVAGVTSGVAIHTRQLCPPA